MYGEGWSSEGGGGSFCLLMRKYERKATIRMPLADHWNRNPLYKTYYIQKGGRGARASVSLCRSTESGWGAK